MVDIFSKINRYKFYLGLLIFAPGRIKACNLLKKTDKYTLSELQDYQNKRLRKTIDYSYDNVPYYRKLFDRLHLLPSDIQTVQDLYKLPILTKKDITKNKNDFYPINSIERYRLVSTGGSTGKPLKYRIGRCNSHISFASLLRGWGMGGYQIGDRVAIIGGTSLTERNITLKAILRDFILNTRRYSSYSMDKNILKRYVDNMIKWQPSYIGGYPSSIFSVAKYVHDNKLQDNFHIKSIFTTSEMLFKNQRDFISDVFRTDVYDTYGLGDGGISAFECSVHRSMHIDMERGVLEVVDENGRSIYEQEGRIIATTLNEFSMPLIRYDTGDVGVTSLDRCSCGCERPLLKQLSGRAVDVLNLNGKLISGLLMTATMREIDVLQFQVIQTGKDKLLIKIQKGESYTDDDESFIVDSIVNIAGEVAIVFEYVDNFQIDSGKKHRFVTAL